uniref:Uncharacterized protein n=1 Tax=Glossina pallidipes TaxID=7398 RepID=A0A1B0AJD7_GLOPL
MNNVQINLVSIARVGGHIRSAVKMSLVLFLSIVRKLILIHQPSKYNLKNCDEETHTVRRLITIAKNTNLVEVDWSEELVAFSMQWSFWSHFNLEQILLIVKQ